MVNQDIHLQNKQADKTKTTMYLHVQQMEVVLQQGALSWP